MDKTNRCQVCGDKAHVANYGALSCPSCKIFFRRHGFHPEKLPKCPKNNLCEIAPKSRRICSFCRFSKCLSVGMHPHRIRKEEIPSKKTRSSQANLLFEPITLNQTIKPLNLLSNDVSCLNKSNWTLLSNVIHAFDKFSPLNEVQITIQHLSNNPINVQHNLQQAKNIVGLICQSVLLSISTTADFRIMTTDEQCSLVYRSIRGIWTFYSMFICHLCNLFDNATTRKVMIPLYGYRDVERVRLISLRLDPDVALVKFLLMVLSFSSNCFVVDYDQTKERDCLLTGTYRLFGSQNYYIETLWKYMIYRYGFIESVKRYSAMIKVMLDEIELGSTIFNNNQIHHNLANEILQKTSQSLFIDRNKNVPLWGKTNIK